MTKQTKPNEKPVVAGTGTGTGAAGTAGADAGSPDAGAGAGASAGVTVTPDVLQQLTGVMETLAARLQKLEERPEPAVPPKVPPKVPAAPPVRTAQQSDQDYTSQLQQYAIAQAIEAARYRTASEYGIGVEDLQGKFDSEEAMRAYAATVAKMKALEKSAQETQQKLDQLLSAGKPPEESGEPAAGNTGGPTGMTPQGEADLEEAYTKVRLLGRTEEAQLRILDIMYKDPSRRLRRVMPQLKER